MKYTEAVTLATRHDFALNHWWHLRPISLPGGNMLLPLVLIAWIFLSSHARCETSGDGLGAYDAGNYALALQIWKPLAESGDAEAQFWLAYMYGEEKGVARDRATYWRWMMLSARQGHPAAQFWIGFSYQWGLAATKLDVFEAAHWFRRSADQGNRDAARSLGDLYNTGDGVVQDFTEATRLYAAAAEQGDDAAQELLAGQYLEGRGVQRDLVRAHFWYNVSAYEARRSTRLDVVEVRVRSERRRRWSP